MSDIATRLLNSVLALPDAERAEFRDAIAHSLPGNGELGRDEWEEAWVAECERRSARLAAGRSTDLPHEEVMARLKERYG